MPAPDYGRRRLLLEQIISMEDSLCVPASQQQNRMVILNPDLSVLGRHRFSLEKGHIAYVMILPFIVFFIVFSLYPVYNTFRLSFTDTKTTAPSEGNYIGLDNYTEYFSGIGKSLTKVYDKEVKDGNSPGFMTWVKTIFNYDEYNTDLKAIATTWKIWLINFIPQIAIAMLLSVWFNSSFLKLKMVGLWRSLLYLPNMLMPATVGVIFWKFFQNKLAPANQLLYGTLKILSEPKEFMLDTSFTPLLVSFIQWWMWYGNTIVILVAGMSSISASLYESANITAPAVGKCSDILLTVVKTDSGIYIGNFASRRYANV